MNYETLLEEGALVGNGHFASDWRQEEAGERSALARLVSLVASYDLTPDRGKRRIINIKEEALI